MNEADKKTLAHPVGKVARLLAATNRRSWELATDRQFIGYAWLDAHGAPRLHKVWKGTTARSRDVIVAVARITTAGRINATTITGRYAAQIDRAARLRPPAEPPHQDLAAAQTSRGGGEGGTDAAV